jgi:hypothetical protein
VGEWSLGRRKNQRHHASPRLVRVHIQAGADQANNVADAVQTLASSDILHNTAVDLYRLLAGVILSVSKH